MITPDEALALVIETAETLDPQTVALAEACGLVLAEPIAADRDYPPFPRSMMDGFAVRVADAGQTLPIAGLLAGRRGLGGGIARRPMPGDTHRAPCPPGAEAVVAKEHVVRRADQVTFPAEIRRGQNIAPQGSECRAGQVVMSPGDLVTPMAIGVLASFSRATVRVIPRPSLGIITTGAELAAAEGPACSAGANSRFQRADARGHGACGRVSSRGKRRMRPIEWKRSVRLCRPLPIGTS